MLIEWSDELVLGVEKMDATHREFVLQLNALGEAGDPALLGGLDSFIVHTVEHFEQETRWMQSMAFPPIHCHKEEHEGVLSIMREVRGMVADGKFELGRVLVRELAPWFTNHAATMDATLAMFIKAKGFDPEAVSSAREGLHGRIDCDDSSR
jgi:hemerythrin